jgi:ubiquinone/menaquinone biosynthesis C-methylase UbiE
MVTENLGATRAFSKQAPDFDSLNEANAISQHLRNEFRAEVTKWLKPESRLLELNCGTGLDAFFFSGLGHTVLATDASEGMLAEFRRKMIPSPPVTEIELKLVSFHDLHVLEGRKFDHIVSNFGGLNCSPDLGSVLQQLHPLLHAGGKVTLMIMPRVCPWELLLVVKGKFRTAFRRLSGRAKAQINGEQFNCYYYSPGYVMRNLRKNFRVLTLRGICITVPPEFYLGFAERYPKAFTFLKKIDRAIGSSFPFNRCCDHFLITLEKK